MSEKSFNWKTLFLKEDESIPNQAKETVKSTPPAEVVNKFPDVAPSMANTTTGSNPFIDEVLEVYQKGLDSLNLPEYDFLEFYKSVQAVGASNAASFQMAYMMGKSLKPDLTKDLLVQKASFYKEEIEKVHSKYASTGLVKRNEIIIQQNSENQDLTTAIKELEEKIAQSQAALLEKKAALQKLDTKFVAPIREMDQKIEANNLAKDRILTSIQQIVNGINQYL